MAGLWLLTFLLRKQAESARAASDKILQDFKTIDKSLEKRNDSLGSLNIYPVDSNKTAQ